MLSSVEAGSKGSSRVAMLVEAIGGCHEVSGCCPGTKLWSHIPATLLRAFCAKLWILSDSLDSPRPSFQKKRQRMQQHFFGVLGFCGQVQVGSLISRFDSSDHSEKELRRDGMWLRCKVVLATSAHVSDRGMNMECVGNRSSIQWKETQSS